MASFDISFSGKYLALKEFREWKDVSGLVVLTGHNGSGKSQLLRLIDGRVNGVGRRDDADLHHAIGSISFKGMMFERREVLLFEDNHTLGDGGNVNITEFHATAEKMLSDLKQGRHTYFESNNHDLMALRDHISRKISEAKRNLNLITIEEFKALIVDDWFVFDIAQVYRNLAQIIRRFHSKLVEQILAGTLTRDEAIKKWKSESPWAQLNALLENTTLNFKLSDCWGIAPDSPYSVRFVDVAGNEISPRNLSAGEKAITKILLLTFIHGYKEARPKLILLDEQDAHLEPSAIDGFLESIKSSIVEKYGCTVIMTTHRSETIALAPENSLFELRKSPSEVVKVRRDEAIGKISRNLLKVWTEGQLVLVEADDDQKFYSNHYAWLSAGDPSIAERRLSFISVSKKDGSGGCDLVEKHVEKMRGFVKGLLDGDDKQEAQLNVLRLKRYSIENYYLDPHVLFSLLLEKKKIDLKSLGISEDIHGGNLSEVQRISQAGLQTAGDWIYSQVFSHIPTSILKGDSTLVESKYSNEKVLMIPNWLIRTRGHNLMTAFQTGLSCKFSLDDLHRHAEYQNQMISDDLANTFKRL